MLGQGNRVNDCMPSSAMCYDKGNEQQRAERYKRCLFQDMQTAIGLLKNLDDALQTLHPDVVYKIRNLL